jgi:hypothetical protein
MKHGEIGQALRPAAPMVCQAAATGRGAVDDLAANDSLAADRWIHLPLFAVEHMVSKVSGAAAD